MNEEYILVIKGKPEGPFTLEQLKGLGVKANDFVKTTDIVDYKEAQELPALRALLGFKKPPLLVQYYASFDQRLLATAVDWFIMGGLLILVAFIVALFIPSKENKLTAALGLLACTPVAKFIYQIVMECGVKQATYGKQLLAIRVIDLNGDRLTTGRSVGRNVAKIFSALPFFGGYLLAFFNKRSQCLHDMLADTLVIKDRLI